MSKRERFNSKLEDWQVSHTRSSLAVVLGHLRDWCAELEQRLADVPGGVWKDAYLRAERDGWVPRDGTSTWEQAVHNELLQQTRMLEAIKRRLPPRPVPGEPEPAHERCAECGGEATLVNSAGFTRYVMCRCCGCRAATRTIVSDAWHSWNTLMRAARMQKELDGE